MQAKARERTQNLRGKTEDWLINFENSFSSNQIEYNHFHDFWANSEKKGFIERTDNL